MSKKILVFGANGMLGSYLSNYFEKKGYEVAKTDRDNDDEEEEERERRRRLTREREERCQIKG